MSDASVTNKNLLALFLRVAKDSPDRKVSLKEAPSRLRSYLTVEEFSKYSNYEEAIDNAIQHGVNLGLLRIRDGVVQLGVTLKFNKSLIYDKAWMESQLAGAPQETAESKEVQSSTGEKRSMLREDCHDDIPSSSKRIRLDVRARSSSRRTNEDDYEVKTSSSTRRKIPPRRRSNSRAVHSDEEWMYCSRGIEHMRRARAMKNENNGGAIENHRDANCSAREVSNKEN